VKALKLGARQVRQSFVQSKAAPYSAMTYHRHRVAQMLAGRFQYSINLDPDVLCVRAWDLRLLLNVSFIGGRPVGNSARTLEFVRRRLRHDVHTGAQAESSSSESFLDRKLNVSVSRLQSVDELNGGVLVFNNAEAARLRWWQKLATFHAALRRVLEGDQDLVSLVLAANPGFQRYLLPLEYNFAYRRDRDRSLLPDSILKRMKNGVSAQEVVNVHFVQDGKPWARQELAAYPDWMLAVRLNHLRDWVRVARGAHGPLPTAPFLQAALRPPSAPEHGNLTSLVNGEYLRRCRCFVRSLAIKPHSQPLQALTRGATTIPEKLTVGGRLLTRREARRSVESERNALLAACSDGRREEDDCRAPLGEAASQKGRVGRAGGLSARRPRGSVRA